MAPKQKVHKEKARRKPWDRQEAAARLAIKKQKKSVASTPALQAPVPIRTTQYPTPDKRGMSRKAQEVISNEKKTASDNRFPDFAKFQKPKQEGYKYLKLDFALEKGHAAGPCRLGYSVGCLSRTSYVATVPYPQAFRTMDDERWDLEEKWSLKHALSLGRMAPPVDHGLIRYGESRGESN